MRLDPERARPGLLLSGPRCNPVDRDVLVLLLLQLPRVSSASQDLGEELILTFACPSALRGWQSPAPEVDLDALMWFFRAIAARRAKHIPHLMMEEVK